MEFDVKKMKELWLNILRKHIKIGAASLVSLLRCKNGILVWQDMANGGGNYGFGNFCFAFLSEFNL